MMNRNAAEVKNLTKKHHKFLLDNISLALPEGCIIGLIGENGAGKSTLIRLMLGCIKKDAGEITLLGECDEKKFPALRQKIGVVPDEVAFPEKFKLKHIKKSMSLLFDEWDNEAFDGYIKRFEIDKDTKFKNYSFGMKKKLGIAVALSHNAKLIVLDEATSGLDPIARDELADILYDYTRDEKNTVLFSSHIVSDLEKLCDYIAALHKGRLLFFGEKDVLLDSCRMVSCTKEELNKIPKASVKGKRISPYGVQAVVKTADVPFDMESHTVTLEDLFVFTVKEEK